MAKKITCGATPKVVTEHSQILQSLNNRTIRIEAGIAVAVFMIMALGGWEYFKDKEAKKTATVENIPVSVASVKVFKSNKGE